MGQLLRSRKALTPLLGFTLIELLMVIIIVGTLGAVAMPKFLDFRQEAKVAASLQLAASIVTGIKLQHKQTILKCKNSSQAFLPLESLEQNDVTLGLGALCTSNQIPNEADRKIIDAPRGFGSLPINPVTGLNTIGIAEALADGESYSTNGTCKASSDGPIYGWCYNPETGSFIAANNPSERVLASDSSTGGDATTGDGGTGDGSTGGDNSTGGDTSGNSSVVGCMDYGALNFDPSATSHDGASCTYPPSGCTDTSALNYDSNAQNDDGSCTYNPIGCTTWGYDNYSSRATTDDGSCACSSGRTYGASGCAGSSGSGSYTVNSCTIVGGMYVATGTCAIGQQYQAYWHGYPAGGNSEMNFAVGNQTCADGTWTSSGVFDSGGNYNRIRIEVLIGPTFASPMGNTFCPQPN